jgi:hypothetical protein
MSEIQSRPVHSANPHTVGTSYKHLKQLVLGAEKAEKFGTPSEIKPGWFDLAQEAIVRP